MPDLSMCENKECPRRFKCYRYMAIADPCWQSFYEFEHKDCNSFIEIGTRIIDEKKFIERL